MSEPNAEVWQTYQYGLSYGARSLPVVSFRQGRNPDCWDILVDGMLRKSIAGSLEDAEKAAREVLRRELFAALKRVGNVQAR